VSETPLLSVHAAMRMAAPEKARAWKIKNPGVINPITGQPVSFKLIPTTSELSFSLRACFGWCTAHQTVNPDLFTSHCVRLNTSPFLAVV
jgi:hypothetical protein